MSRSTCRPRAAICARSIGSISSSAPAETLGIVGESGCGKTMLSRAILQLLPKKAKLSGRVMFDGQDLVSLDRERLRKLRGRSLAVVFQDPMTSLNPVLTIGTQLIETLQEHLELDLACREEAQRRVAGRGRHSRAGTATDAISASAFRRHAAAGGDRDCAVLRAETADRGRADHRARRHHPGADPRSPGARAAPPAHGDDHHHP